MVALSTFLAFASLALAPADALRRGIQAKVSGNRGTGLSPGTWTWDGGMMWNGINLNPSFKLDVRIKEVNDNTFTADALDSSYINGETLPPGGYKDVTGTYARVQTGLWTVRKGYHLKKRMCTTAGTCMNELLIREGQSKMLMYGTVNGITAWVETKNSAKQAAAALVETKVSGNRGTGLSPGTWTWDGGMMWNGINLNPSFKLDVRIKEVNDNTFTADALDSSYINGETLPPGGYKDVTGTYARVQTGLWTVRKGYHLKKRMCTTAGTCMNELLIREGQSKMLMYGTVNGITAWVETKNSAKQAAASLAETKVA